MNPLTFSLLASMCLSNYANVACNKTEQAYIKQEGFYSDSQKFASWAKDKTGVLGATVAAGAFMYATQKKLTYGVGNQETYGKYSANYQNGAYSVGITWRFP